MYTSVNIDSLNFPEDIANRIGIYVTVAHCSGYSLVPCTVRCLAKASPRPFLLNVFAC